MDADGFVQLLQRSAHTVAAHWLYALKKTLSALRYDASGTGDFDGTLGSWSMVGTVEQSSFRPALIRSWSTTISTGRNCSFCLCRDEIFLLRRDRVVSKVRSLSAVRRTDIVNELCGTWST
jgi:hypothetical protein